MVLAGVEADDADDAAEGADAAGGVGGFGDLSCGHDIVDRLRFGVRIVLGQQVCMACGLPVRARVKGSRGQSSD